MQRLGIFSYLFMLLLLGLAPDTEAQLRANAPTLISLLKDRLVKLDCFKENDHSAENNNINIESTTASKYDTQMLSHERFSQILSSEDIDGLSNDETNAAWEEMIAFEWQQMENQTSCVEDSKQSQLNPDETNICDKYGFIVCHLDESNASGLYRKNEILKLARAIGHEISLSDFPIYNNNDGMCHYGTLTVSAARAMNQISDYIMVQPLSSVGKIRKGSISDEEEIKNKQNDTFEHEQMSSSDSENKDSKQVDEFPMIRVHATLCPNIVNSPTAATQLASNFLSVTQHDLKVEMNDNGSRRSLLAESFFWTSSFVSLDEGGNDAQHENPRNARSSFSSEYSSNTHKHNRRLKWTSILQDALSPEVDCPSVLTKAAIKVEFITSEQSYDLSYEFSTENKEWTVCHNAFIVSLATKREVCSVEKEYSAMLLNSQSQWILQSGVTEERPWFDKGLTGTGQVVQVSDSGLDTDNCYFWDSSSGELKDGTVQSTRRKVVQYFPYKDDLDVRYGHGTHVSGTVAGRRSSDGAATDQLGIADGVARDAKIAFYDCNAGGGSYIYVPSAGEMFPKGQQAGAYIHNGSWGSSWNTYMFRTRDFDAYTYENEDFLIFMAAGNSGYRNRMQTILSPANAKNVVAVGASKNKDYLVDFSSRGPTTDGRLKPDIVAPGYRLTSAKAEPGQIGECDASGATFRMSGTSMASPGAAGTGALIRQYFVEGWYPTGTKVAANTMIPSGTLIKAVLLNGAQSMLGVDRYGTISPVSVYDNNIGFGRINLLNSMPLQGENKLRAFVEDKKPISDSDFDEYTFVVDLSSDQCTTNTLSATLVWADPPAASGCTRCLINDLDLVLFKNNAATVHPNGRNSKDDMNNVERIQIPVVHGDEIRVFVKAANLATSTQTYALVVTGCMEETTLPSMPSSSPSLSFSPTSSVSPSVTPSSLPTMVPSVTPSSPPTNLPSSTLSPTSKPSSPPTNLPSLTFSPSSVPSLAPSPMRCDSNEVHVRFQFQTDRWFGDENTWKLKEANGTVVASGGPYPRESTSRLYEYLDCFVQACYTLTIYDSYGDGLFDPGWFALWVDYDVVFQGRRFRHEISHSFCKGSDAPSSIPSSFIPSSSPTNKPSLHFTNNPSLVPSTELFCDINQYELNHTTCVQCPDNHISNAGSEDLSDCTKCLDGYILLHPTDQRCSISEEYDRMIDTARGWRIWAVSNIHTNFWWAVDVKSIKMYPTSNCSGTEVSIDGTYVESDNAGQGWGPENAFENSLTWGGRRDENDLFYLGVMLNNETLVRCMQVDFDTKHMTELRVQAFVENEWKNVWIERDVTAGVRNISGWEFIPEDAPSIAPSLMPTTPPTYITPSSYPTAKPSMTPSSAPTVTEALSCATNEFHAYFYIDFDTFPEEISWEITDTNENVVANGGNYTNERFSKNNMCLPLGCYVLTMRDTYGDGIMFSNGQNGYYLYVDRRFRLKGGDFEFEVSHSFCELDPQSVPSSSPSKSPSFSLPSNIPTLEYSSDPSLSPTLAPSSSLSVSPTSLLSATPSLTPTTLPSVLPSIAPSARPSVTLSDVPSVISTAAPSSKPSLMPTTTPTKTHSSDPSSNPMLTPTLEPSSAPSYTPTKMPTLAPSLTPSLVLTSSPTQTQSSDPSSNPTLTTSSEPSSDLSSMPSTIATLAPSSPPSLTVSFTPTIRPTFYSSNDPTLVPSSSPLAALEPHAAVKVTVPCVLRIANVTLPDNSEDRESLLQVLEQTISEMLDAGENIDVIVKTINGIPVNNISASARAAIVFNEPNDANITFDIVEEIACVDACEDDIESVDSVVNVTTQRLTQSLTSGSFIASLTSNAASVGVTALENASVNAEDFSSDDAEVEIVTTAPTAAPTLITDTPPSSHQPSTSSPPSDSYEDILVAFLELLIRLLQVMITNIAGKLLQPFF